MKYLISSMCCLLSMLTVAGQQAPQSVFNTRGIFELTGRIDAYHPSAMADSVTLTTFSVAGWPKDTSVLLDANGGFSIRTYRPYGGEFLFSYKGLPITFYAGASERMTVVLNMDKWTAAQDDAIKVTGGSVGVSKTIWEYQNHHRFREFPPDPYKDTSITDRQYAEMRIERMKKELAFLDLYIAVRKPVNPVFEEWCRNDIRYGAAREIVFRCFAGKVNSQITHRELMALVKDFPVNNPKALKNANYYGFINFLAVGFMMIVNNNKALEGAVRQQGNSRLAECIRQVDLYAQGMVRELLYYNIYTYALDTNQNEKPVEERLRRMVKDPVLRKSMVADRLSVPVVLRNKP